MKHTAIPRRGHKSLRWRYPRLVLDAPPMEPAVACAPRPWLSREDGECAYPVAGYGMQALSCCNPCGRANYCQGHRLAMVRPSKPATIPFQRKTPCRSSRR